MRETWYVLENGDAVDPSDVAPDAAGGLVHKSGAPVAMRGDVPHSRGVELDAERQLVGAGEPSQSGAAAKLKDMKPAVDADPYKTREVKGR